MGPAAAAVVVVVVMAMTRERWQQIERLWDEALSLAADGRDTFLDRACAGDEELRRDIAALLVAADCCGDFLERPAIIQVVAAPLLAQE